MRELKFRAWDDSIKEMKYGAFSLDAGGMGAIDIGWNSEDVMHSIFVEQFTGLHDKNGTEIYEGDIITNGFERKTVERCNGGWNPFIDMMETDDAWHWEIIGNIHENSELL